MINRRNFLSQTAALGAATGLFSLPAFRAMSQETTMRLYWWGAPIRTERTLKVAKLFEAAVSGVKINGEVGGADYWTKLTTMIAGANAPDIYQLEPGRFADFARRGATLPLNDYLGTVIKTDKFAPGVLDLGTVDGKVAGIPLSFNSLALFYDTAMFKQTSITPPSETTTWEDYAKICVDLTKAIGKRNVWASGNCSRYIHTYQAWLTQRGKLLYAADGGIGFSAEDAADWFGYWSDLAQAGGCTSAEVQTLDTTQVDGNPLSTGNSVMGIGFSNQLSAYQAVYKSPLGITSLPILGASAPSGLFYRPGMHWSIASTAKNPELAAQFINFFVNDPEAGKVLAVERGMPVNTDVQNLIEPALDDVAKMAVQYTKSIASRVGPYPPPVPVGATEFDTRALRPIADRVAFGQMTPKEAGKMLFSEGKRIFRT